MNIAYLANIRFPSERAHAVQIAHMCQAFAQAGDKVDLYVSKREDPTFEKVYQCFGFEPLFSLYTLAPYRIYIKLKFTFYTGELLFALNFLLTRKTSKYDVIYSRSEWILYLLSFFVGAHKLSWESHEAKYNFAARRILKKDIKTIVISSGIRDFYIRQGIDTEQLQVADDGVDESFFEGTVAKSDARRALGLPQKAFIAMYVGGFDTWKGVETFFAASALVPTATFVAIGGTSAQVGKMREKYPKVQFLGARSYRELVQNQQAADILVVPNTAQTMLSSSYTSPLKLFAHMASGLPLVVSDVVSITSVTGDDLVTVVEPDNLDTLAAGIMEVFQNYDEKLQKAGELKLVSKKYTWTERAKSIVEFIKNK
ncbi:MAG: glycosyltransferase involved in cell wall biosynthesis [Candidatus Paceibacteria bacterium]|jgi:glycosyltransferase involved in cell wall biosynthesis